MDQQQSNQLANENYILLDVQQPKLNKLYVVCTINSKEPFTDPNTIQTDFVSNLYLRLALKAETIMALKIPRALALIKLTGSSAAQNKQVDEQPNQYLSCFKLLDSDNLIGGYTDGRLIHKQISNQRVIKEYNKLNQELIIKKKPLKIHIFQKYFITLFLEGVVAIYNQEYQGPKTTADYDKFIRLSFQQHNPLGSRVINLVKPKVLKQFIMDNNFQFNFLNYGEFTNFQLLQNQVNPQYLFRFETPTLNDVEILPFSPLEHLNQPEQRMESGLCVALCGLDGCFRIMDVIHNKPFFSFKTESCGICSFTFNPNFSSVCIGAQDDSAYLINFNHKISWIRLVGHNSFISRGVFSSISATEFRIICGSYDGKISITDVDLSTLIEEKSLFVRANEQQTLQVKNMQSVSQDGVANLSEYQNYVVCMNFDGSIKIFLLQ